MMSEPGSHTGDLRRERILTGELRRTVFWLALPVLCEQFLVFLVGFYDTWLAGRLNPEAVVAVGFAAYVGWLASMLFSLVGAGTTALISRSWGAGEFSAANRITNRSLALATIMGVVLYAAIYAAAPLFADLLGLEGEARRTLIHYLRIDAFGHVFFSFSVIGAAALRGSGDMRSPMIVLAVVSVLNVIVSTALVFGVGPWPAVGLQTALVEPIGVDGIVLGTVTARIGGGLLIVALLGSGLTGLRLKPGELTLRGEDVRRILRIGAPAAVDGAIMWGGQFLYLMIIAALATGDRKVHIMDAHMIGIRVEAITYLPAVAWGHAAATMVGQSLGAGDRRRAVAAGHAASMQCSLLAIAITLTFFAGATWIYDAMQGEQIVTEIGAPAFRLLAIFQVPLVVSIIYVYALRAAGDTRFPMGATILGVLGVRLPVGWLFGIHLNGGLIGAWIGMCADMLFRAVLVSWRYVRSGWTETAV